MTTKTTKWVTTLAFGLTQDKVARVADKVLGSTDATSVFDDVWGLTTHGKKPSDFLPADVSIAIEQVRTEMEILDDGVSFSVTFVFQLGADAHTCDHASLEKFASAFQVPDLEMVICCVDD
jgi:hypothetical protein